VTGNDNVPARLRSAKRTVKRREGDLRRKESGKGALTPYDTLLVQEIIDDLDAITHLCLCPLRHGNHGTADLPRLDVIQGRDPFRAAFFQLLSVACHASALLMTNAAIFAPGVRSAVLSGVLIA
jgi:hypothetical protein